MDIRAGLLAGESLLYVFYFYTIQMKMGGRIGEVVVKNKGNWNNDWGECISFGTVILEEE